MATKKPVNETFTLPNAEGLAYELCERVDGKLSARLPMEDYEALVKLFVERARSNSPSSDSHYHSRRYLKEEQIDYMAEAPLRNETPLPRHVTSRLDILADEVVLGTLTVTKYGQLPLEVTYRGRIPGYQDPETGAEEVTLRGESPNDNTKFKFIFKRTDKHTDVALTVWDLWRKPGYLTQLAKSITASDHSREKIPLREDSFNDFDFLEPTHPNSFSGQEESFNLPETPLERGHNSPHYLNKPYPYFHSKPIKPFEKK